MTRPSPVATSRVQLTPRFGFGDLVEVLDHLRDLGVSHLYLSPIAEAVPGSEHGYDVVDHRVVRRDLGGETKLWRLLDAAAERRLGVIVDHVPNHCSVARPELNPPWWSVLERGPDSPSAKWFDIDWSVAGGRIVVPRLAAPLAEELAADRFSVVEGATGYEVHYGELCLPLREGTAELPLVDALAEQHYVLQWWREPRRNVRRFFTIDDLVAVRVEDPAVAAVVDAIPRALLDHPAFAGVRVDHVDGLADPGRYLRSLRDRLGDRVIYVEKILGAQEWLPVSWPVDGTTGYEHAVVTEHALLDPAAEEPLVASWSQLTGDDRPFEDIGLAARREVLAAGLRPDLERLARTVARSAHVDDPRRPSPDAVVEACAELIVALDRYRTYLGDDPTSEDALARAHALAASRRPDLTDALGVLVDLVDHVDEVRDRFQQLSGPAMAKGVEDRAFYRYLPLASLCEVGGEPQRWAVTGEDFHDHQREVQTHWPATLLAGTTHDTKRSEDVRARSLALAEDAAAWGPFVDRWYADHSAEVGDVDPRAVSLALQTVVTAWPLDRERLAAYLVKAAREGELSTSWTEPDERVERSLDELAARLVAEVTEGGDIGTLGAWAATLERRGRDRTVAALVLRLTCPGVPDLYQGSAGPLLTLVDPDNRRPPDWDEQCRLLESAGELDLPTALTDAPEATRAVVIGRLLRLRGAQRGSFDRDAGYVALTADGEHADRLLAYARTERAAPQAVVVVAGALPGRSWGDTTVELPHGPWRDVLSDGADTVQGGGAVDVAGLLHSASAAVLVRVEEPAARR